MSSEAPGVLSWLFNSGNRKGSHAVGVDVTGGVNPAAGLARTGVQSGRITWNMTLKGRGLSTPISREHWMSDKNCKVCYDCQAPFTTLRRRHHCRFCGLIFCGKCSPNFLDGSLFNTTGQLRVCTFCNKIFQRQNDSKADKGRKSTPNSSLGGSGSFNYAHVEPFSPRQPPPDEEVEDEEQDEGLLSSTYQRMFLKMGEWENSATLKNEYLASLDDDDEEEDHNPFAQKGSTRELSSDEESAENNEVARLTEEAAQAAPFSPEVSPPGSPTTSPPAGVPAMFAQLDRPMSVTEAAIKSPMFENFPSLQDTEDTWKVEDSPEQLQKHRQSLLTAAQDHLRLLVKELVERDGLDAIWVDVIVRLASCAQQVTPNILGGDMLDIRHYVKVKKLLGGTIDDCRCLHGVVARKQVAHKKMKTSIERPRILIFSCAIEYERVENRLSSLDTLLNQEKEYINMLVAKIIDLKPTLVVVGKSISRLAQDMFLEAGISLVLNVKPSLLHRVARMTGGDILASADVRHLAKAKMGTCSHFEVRTLLDDENKKYKIMEFDGCATWPGCTLVLRGAPKETLSRVKEIALFASYAAYNLRVETEYHFDHFGTLEYLPLTVYEEDEDTGNQSEEDIGPSKKVIPAKSFESGDGTSEGHTSNILSVSSNVRFSVLEHLNQTLPLTPKEESMSGEVAADIASRAGEGSSAVGGSPDSSRRRTGSVGSIVEDFHPFDCQNIYCGGFRLNNSGQQCLPPVVMLVSFYSENDVSLGQYLMHTCFNTTQVCPNARCKDAPIDHTQYFTHERGMVRVVVDNLPDPMPTGGDSTDIYMWSYCKVCNANVTPCLPLSELAASYSFGKFLECTFYNHSVASRNGSCSHSIHRDHIRFFAYDSLYACFEYEKLELFDTVVPAVIDMSNEDTSMREREFVDVLEVCNNMYIDVAQRIADFESDEAFVAKKTPEFFQQLKMDCRNEKDELLLEGRSLMDSTEYFAFNVIRRKVVIKLQKWNHTISTLWDEKIALHGKKSKKDDDKDTMISSNISTTASEFDRESVRDTHTDVEEDVSVIDLDLTVDAVENPPADHFSPIIGAANPATGDGTAQASADKKITVSGGRRSSLRAAPSPILHSTKHAVPLISLTLPSSSTQSSTKPSIKGNAPGLTNHMCVLLPPCVNGMVIPIYEDELSSVIAYSLSSVEYKEMASSLAAAPSERGHSPGPVVDEAHPPNPRTESTSPVPDDIDGQPIDALLNRAKNHIKHSFKSDDGAVSFTCTTYYATQFEALRQQYCESTSAFVISLSRCKKWESTGGKSSAVFLKTLDDRFILKQIPKIEMMSFLENAPAYFDYMTQACFYELPTVLVKILGAFKIIIKRNGSKVFSGNVVIMENLFCGHHIDQVFDLKGSMRNRYVQQKTDERNTLLDENFIEMTRGAPLLLDEQAKTTQSMGVWNDSLFLSKINVVDYSLLVGIDNTNCRLIMGIIDYMRQYTWDKQIETLLKSSGLLGQRGKTPTVIEPKQYKVRFREAMNRYMMMVPTRLSNLETPPEHELEDD